MAKQDPYPQIGGQLNTTTGVYTTSYHDSHVVVVVELVFYGPSTHFMSFRARSVNLATLFLGNESHVTMPVPLTETTATATTVLHYLF